MRREWRRGEPWDRVDPWGFPVFAFRWVEGAIPTKETGKGARESPSLRSAPHPSPSPSLSSIPRNLTPVEVAAEVGSRIFIVGCSGRRPGPEKELAGPGWVCKQLRSDGKCLEGRGASELRLPKIIQGAAVLDSETGSGCLSCGKPQAPHQPHSGNRWH